MTCCPPQCKRTKHIGTSIVGVEKTVDHNGDCVPQKRGFAGKFVKNDEKEPATFSKNSIFSATCVLKKNDNTRYCVVILFDFT